MSEALQPIVFVKDGGVFANSRDVAAFFEKAHKDVLRAIDNLECSQEFRGRNFTLTMIREIVGATHRELRAFDMTKDGFAFLVMGFTGAEAARFKEAYIARFNAMEAELHAPALPDLSNPLLLQQLLAEHLAKRIEAEKAVEAARPKVEFYDRFANAEGLYGRQNAGRMLGHPPNKFVEQLKTIYLFYQGGSLVPRSEYQDRGIFKVMALEGGGQARYQTYITPKGLQYLAHRLKKTETLPSADLLSRLA